MGLTKESSQLRMYLSNSSFSQDLCSASMISEAPEVKDVDAVTAVQYIYVDTVH